MKKTVCILFLISALVISADTLTKRIYDNNDYYNIVQNYNSDYSYILDNYSPVIPQQKINIDIKGIIFIDSFSLVIVETDTINNVKPIAGESALPLGFPEKERHSLIETKGLFPASMLQLHHGQQGNIGKIFGTASVFQFSGNTLLHHKIVDITVHYTVTPIFESKSAPLILVITEDSLKSAWSLYQDIYSNCNVIMRTANEISTICPEADIQHSLRSYAQTLYADSNLQAMIIGLDTDIIPGIYVDLRITPQIDSASAAVITDKYYACLDGNWDGDNDGRLGEIDDSIDIFPDIRIARCPLLSSSAINNFISKIITFKQSTGDTILLIASYLDGGTDGSESMENLVKNVPFTSPVKRLYEKDGNLSSASFIQAINHSPFTVSHDGHGNYNAIQTGINYTYTSNIDNLSNTMPVVMYSLSCLSAAYDYDCIAEHFLNAPGGGFYIGNSRYGWYTPYFPGFGTGDLFNASFYHYFMNGYSNPADALNRAIEDYSSEIVKFNDYRWAFMALTYFGDPMINVYRNLNNSTINIQHAAKNQAFSFTIPVHDSIVVTAIKDSNITKTLYENNNLFYCSVENEDSIIIRLASSDCTDTFRVIYTYPADTMLYLESYALNPFCTDSLMLLLNLHSTGNSQFKISLQDIDSFITHVDDDSLFMINGDTVLSFKYAVHCFPGENRFLPIIINNDTLLLQADIDMKTNVQIHAIAEKAYYNENDTIPLEIHIENPSANTYSFVYIFSKSFTHSFNDTLFFDSIIPFSHYILYDTVIAENYDSLDYYIYITDNCQALERAYTICLNESENYFDCENISSFSIDSSTAYFHLSPIRSNSDSQSFFSGYDYTSSYPSNYITSLYAPPFSYDTSSIFGFSTFYDVEGGFDYCIVSMHSDSFDVPLTALSGQSDNWENLVFNASDYQFNENDRVYMRFSFYSETDSYQYEGWYIDDIVLPASTIFLGINNSEIYPNTLKSLDNNVVFDLNKQILLCTIAEDNTYMDIFDISGRLIESKLLRHGIHSINSSIISGMYFVRFKHNNSSTVKKVSIIR